MLYSSSSSSILNKYIKIPKFQLFFRGDVTLLAKVALAGQASCSALFSFYPAPLLAKLGILEFFRNVLVNQSVTRQKNSNWVKKFQTRFWNLAIFCHFLEF